MSEHDSDREKILSRDDLFDARDAGVLDAAGVDRLLAWHAARSMVTDGDGIEATPRLNAVMVAYYFGALMMISACAWFLGDKWKSLGSAGVLATALVYFAVALTAGLVLRRKGYAVGGGLLVTVAVSLVALITYCVEDLLGWWPAAAPGAYKDYYPYVNASWIGMELATMAAALIALRHVRFAFLVAPFAFSAWFLSMDLWALLHERHVLEWSDRCNVSIVVGLAILLCGFLIDRWRQRRKLPRSQDLAFWCYLFGLLAFWGGMTANHSDSEAAKLFYALVNVGLVCLAVALRRTTFLVFGALGIYVYLGHLAYDLFKDSIAFPFALALLGFALVFAAVFAQRQLRRARQQPAST